jgi:hypothetical protein
MNTTSLSGRSDPGQTQLTTSDLHTDDPGQIVVTLKRVGRGPLFLDPNPLVVDAGTFGVPELERQGRFSLRVSSGWRAEPVGELAWKLVAHEIDVDRPLVAELKCEAGGKIRTWQVSVPVGLDLVSTLDPVAHTFQEPNRASVLGDILPDRSIFEETFSMRWRTLSDALFEGIYSDIVFLRREGPTRGGLCSGMARWAIARSLGEENEPPDRSSALRRITAYHGRQLSDRSFLLGIPTFLRGSPAASYRIVRRDLLTKGWTDRAFDVAVPKPWRKDVLRALIGSGHTIVPYRIIQPNPKSARVEVYDPNRPPATLESPQVVEFDLESDRYAYRQLVALTQDDAGLVAARQRGYAKPGSAVAAGLVSLGMRLTGWSSGRRAQSSPANEPAGL